MRVLKIAFISLIVMVILFYAGSFLYGVLFGFKIDWTENVYRKQWDIYKNIKYGFSFEHPPVILIEEEDPTISEYENVEQTLSLNSKGEIWGLIYILPVDQTITAKNYERSVPIKLYNQSVTIGGKMVEKQINLTNDKTKVSSVVSEIVLSQDPSLKLRFVMAFRLSDSDKVRVLKEKYFDHMVGSLKVR